MQTNLGKCKQMQHSKKGQCWPGPSAESCRGLSLHKFLEGFARDFPGGFFSALFPTNKRRKNPETNSAKNPAAQKKISEKSVLPKTDPNKCKKTSANAVVGVSDIFLSISCALKQIHAVTHGRHSFEDMHSNLSLCSLNTA